MLNRICRRSAGEPVKLGVESRRQDPRRHHHAVGRGAGARARHRRAQGAHRLRSRSSRRRSSASPQPDSPAGSAACAASTWSRRSTGGASSGSSIWSTLLSDNRGDQVVVSYLRPVDVPEAMGGLCDLGVLEPGAATLTPCRASRGRSARRRERAHADVLERTGIESADMYVAFVPEVVERVARRAAAGRPRSRCSTACRDSVAHVRGRAGRRRRQTARAAVEARRARPWRARSQLAQGAVGRRVRPALRALRRSAPTTGCPSRPTASSPTRTRLVYALHRRLRGDRQRHQVHRRRDAAARRRDASRSRASAAPSPSTTSRGKQAPRAPTLLRLGDGAHLGQPRPHQPAAHPGARRRPPALLPLRGRAPAGRCRCASARWRAWWEW